MIAALNRFAMARGLPFSSMKDEPTLDRAVAALRARDHELVACAREWVEINSYTANVAAVDAVGAKVTAACDGFGLAHQHIAAPGYGQHLVWRTPAAGPPILLVGHHDTVFPPGHFESWAEADGRITAPGILDMKG